jgi:hypothetical protein
MFFHRKAHWRTQLRHCDHALAASAFMHYLIDHHPIPALAAALEAYFASPRYRTALAVLDADPALILIFRECLPGGIYQHYGIAVAQAAALVPSAPVLAAALWDARTPAPIETVQTAR